MALSFQTGFSDITGAAQAILGGSSGVDATTAGTTTTTGKQTEQLKLDQAAIAKIIEDVLGGTEGLASIFGGEQTAGIFDSSVAAQAAGDLTSKLVGEIAKLTGVREITTEEEAVVDTRTEQVSESEGLIQGLFSSLGF